MSFIHRGTLQKLSLRWDATRRCFALLQSVFRACLFSLLAPVQSPLDDHEAWPKLTLTPVDLVDQYLSGTFVKLTQYIILFTNYKSLGEILQIQFFNPNFLSELQLTE